MQPEQWVQIYLARLDKDTLEQWLVAEVEAATAHMQKLHTLHLPLLALVHSAQVEKMWMTRLETFRRIVSCESFKQEMPQGSGQTITAV